MPRLASKAQKNEIAYEIMQKNVKMVYKYQLQGSRSANARISDVLLGIKVKPLVPAPLRKRFNQPSTLANQAKLGQINSGIERA